MKNQELLKIYSAYLPYGVKCVIGNVRCNIAYLSSKKIAVIRKNGIGEVDKYKWESFPENRIKLILRPLSDLTKEIEHNGERFIPINELNDKTKFMGNQFKIYIDINGDTRLLYIGQPNRDFIRGLNPKEKLIEWHFDVFGLIDKNLAVNLNEVK